METKNPALPSQNCRSHVMLATESVGGGKGVHKRRRENLSGEKLWRTSCQREASEGKVLTHRRERKQKEEMCL